MAEARTFVAGGGVIENAFSYSTANGGTLTVGTAAYPVERFTFRSATAIIQQGTAPTTTAAHNIDASSYAGVALNITNGTGNLQLFQAANGTSSVGSISGILSLFAANQGKWTLGTTTLESEWIATQVTAKIRGGSTNGLAIRNSGNTRDNVSFADTAVTLWNNGTTGARLDFTSATGEVPAGARLRGLASDNLIFTPDVNGASGSKIVGMYFDATVYRSAFEVANTTGFGVLALMRSGGNVVLGGTAAGATASGTLAFSIAATEPTATVDLVHVYGFDRAAGARAFSCYQEAAVIAVGGAATNEWPVRINGTNYMVQLRAA